MNVFILDEKRDWFIAEGRIDPMTRGKYKLGDRVVVCNSCKMVSLESTWNDCGGCTSPGCNGKITSRRFLKIPPPKTHLPPNAINRIVLRNGGVEQQADNTYNNQMSENECKMIIKARHFYN